MTELTEALEMMMQETEEFYSDATEVADKNVKHPDFKEFSRSSTADYKRDLDMVERLYGKYCTAYEAVINNGPTKARVSNLQKAWSSFALAVAALEESNAMFTAYLDEGVAEKAAGLMVLISALIKGQQKQVGELLKDIEEIEKLLKKARKEVTEAQVQMGLNLAITAATLCFPTLRGARAIYVALSVAGTKLAADEFLGPTGPSNASAIKTAATDYAGMADEFGKVGNSLTTIYSTVDTYASDDKEIGKAKKTVEAVKKRLKTAQKAHAALERLIAGAEKDLLRVAISLEKAVKAASAARGRYEQHEMNRYDLLDMIEE